MSESISSKLASKDGRRGWFNCCGWAKPFITIEIEKLGAEADTVTGVCWLDPFLVSWSKFALKSINFHLCVYLQVLSKIFKPISRHFLSSIEGSTMMAKLKGIKNITT